jgi:enhancer of polycomb-like protein
MEIMLDVMEKATGYDTIIRSDQAEDLIVSKLPQLYHMYPIKGKAGIVTLKQVISDIYTYWVQKRSKLKRPLLRRFWPGTSSDDTNPHLVFRPREKEKYKLRKKRQNDMDAFRKMEQLRQDFEQVRMLCELVKQREELNRSLVLLQREWFRQKIYEAVDTSGRPRISTHVDKNELDSLMRVDRCFDVQDGWPKKKARRSSQVGGTSSQTNLPVLDGAFGSTLSNMSGLGGGSPSSSPKKPLIVAGQNHGEPAPNFLNPLDTRESYRTTWEGVPPHLPTFVDARPEPTFRFRHRPRVGRGGRLCIDRLPLPPNPNAPTFFRACGGQVHPNETKARLLDLLPTPLDRDRISQRIEAICLNALKEDYEGGVTGPESEENDGEVVLVPMKDWLNTDDQLWGEERYSMGPI